MPGETTVPPPVSLVKAISSKTGYKFKNEQLLSQALTHPSNANNKPNERLELLGDSVLNMVVSTMLYKTYPEKKVCYLHEKRRQVVRGDAVAEVGKEIALNEFIDRKFAQGENKPLPDSILENAVESLIGAIYLDGGFDSAQIFVKRFWRRRVREELEINYKTKLQEWTMQKAMKPPCYRVMERQGPVHDPKFVVQACIDNLGVAYGKGTTKKDAEEEGARYLYRATVAEELQPEDVLDSDGEERVIFDDK